MKRYNFLFCLLIIIFIIFSCNRKSNKLSPPFLPTLTPTNTFIYMPTLIPSATSTAGVINGALNLPVAVYGKKFYIYLFDNFTGFSNAQASISGICGSDKIVPYSIAIPAGTYYLVAFIDVDGNGLMCSPNAGDYVGVYGTIWPAWPSDANITIEEGQILNCDIELVVGFDNVNGTVYLTESAQYKSLQIFIDIDTNQINSNHVVYKNIFISENIMSVTYSLLVLIPGVYYIYGGIDMDDSGLPFHISDQLGYYGVCWCNPTIPPGYQNANLYNLNPGNIFNFKLGKL